MKHTLPNKHTATLYIVATPIGNLADISLRAIETLKKVDYIAAEDTRTSAKLLQHYGITTPTIACHQHNEQKASAKLLQKLHAGKNIALISDAGTPLISDPGYILVSQAKKQGVKVVPIPGASAIMAALSASGMATDRFLFIGFLAAKEHAKQQQLKALQGFDATMVFYESCHRIGKTVELMIKIFGKQRQVCFARELTKQFETIEKQTLEQLQHFIEQDHNQQKGEMVLIVEGQPRSTEADYAQLDKFLAIMLQNMSASHAAKAASSYFSLPKKICYQRALHLEQS